MKIHNPIIPGFNPDPSVCRVVEEIDGELKQVFYLATSTFEWFPAVCIYRSYDLANWELITHAVKTDKLLDLKGALDSGGSWAPDLTYNKNDGLFYLVYSDVKVTQGRFKDTQNYLITSPSVFGPWSDRIELIGSGFDASMFHEGDKSYLLNVYWDHREFSHPFNGIQLTPYNKGDRTLNMNDSKIIYQGTKAQFTEGPHLYKLKTPEGSYYYLFTAEGGTGWTHQESVARSKELFGEYENMASPLISAYDYPDQEMQKCGHASLFQWLEPQNSQALDNDITSGQWFIAHLASRQIRGFEMEIEREDMTRGWSILGRETSLQNIRWNNEFWPEVVGGINGREIVDVPEYKKSTTANNVKTTSQKDHSQKIDFSKITELPPSLQTLRIPFSDEIGELRDNCLQLKGRQSLASKYIQSLVALRWQSNNFEITTCLSFEPSTYQQSAGLTLFYNTEYWTALHITNSGNSLNSASNNNKSNRVLELTNVEGRQEKSLLGSKGEQISIPQNVDKVYLKAIVEPTKYRFVYSFDNIKWIEIPYDLPTTHFSDDYILKTHSGNFTGPFAGIFAYDYTNSKLPANFYFLDYQEN